MLKNEQNQHITKISYHSPLRGAVNLQSDPDLTNFLITLSILLNKKLSIKADFLNSTVSDYVNILNNYGISINTYGDSAFVQGDLTVNEGFILSSKELYEKYIILLVLSKRGYINLVENKELIDFFSYLGFVCKKDLNGTRIYNKVLKKKSTITFYTFNYEYILLAILSLILNNDKFTIFLPSLNPSLKILFSLLKDIGFVEKIEYGNFVSIYFNTSTIYKDLDDLEVPRDYKEFLFFSVATILTKGDIEFEGINISYLVNSLKILSNFGISYDAFDNNKVRIWFSEWPKEPFPNIQDTGISTEVLRIFLLTVLPILPKNHLPKSISLSSDKHKVLIQDLNSLGCGLEIPQKDLILVKKPGVFRKNEIYFQPRQLEDNYARLLSTLLTFETNLVYHISYILSFNYSILDKLSNLGAYYEHIT